MPFFLDDSRDKWYNITELLSGKKGWERQTFLQNVRQYEKMVWTCKERSV